MMVHKHSQPESERQSGSVTATGSGSLTASVVVETEGICDAFIDVEASGSITTQKQLIGDLFYFPDELAVKADAQLVVNGLVQSVRAKVTLLSSCPVEFELWDLDLGSGSFPENPDKFSVYTFGGNET